MRTALEIAYLGGGFSGWQKQPGRRTVQAEIELALERVCGVAVAVTGAGRTDSGVHAAGQVAHCDAPAAIPVRGLRAALNAALPHDVRVLRARRVAAAFHARRSAIGKRYRYRLSWGATLPPWDALRSWEVPYRLDVSAIAAAATLFVGTHDFTALALSGHSGTGRRGCVRTVRSVSVRGRGRHLAIVVEGDGFLRGMVRRIAGVLVEVGRGARPATWIASLLADPHTRPPAPTAPGHGLTLEKVLYGEW